MMIPFEIVRLAKSGGPLTKRISLSREGKVISDGSACVMSRGRAFRVRLKDLNEFAASITKLEPNEAIALGALNAELPDLVEVVTKRRLTDLNDQTANIIARTANHIRYVPDNPALALIDIDTKGMPPEVAGRLRELGGYWAALLRVLPGLAAVARVIRTSTSTGLYRTDTGDGLKGSGGFHIYLLIRNGGDCERFLKTFHDRCWLNGFGWYMIGAGGQLLERSLIDRTVYAAERLVFEGTPILEPPLAQDRASRTPVVREGAALDTIATCPPLTIVEQAKLRELRAKDAHRLVPDSAKARAAFVTDQAARIAKRAGTTPEQAARVAQQQTSGILLPDVLLPFDDVELAGTTVGRVLADPDRYADATLADPLEGVEYGACKAKIMRRADGTPWINSFAHGQTVYELRYDARSVAAAIEGAPHNQVVSLYTKMMLAADVTQDEAEKLRNTVAKRAGTGTRTLDNQLKQAGKEQASQRAREERDRRAAERIDPRLQIEAPTSDAPWLPQMQVLNDVLGSSTAPEPPMRDIDGVLVQVRDRRVPGMHALTPLGTNEGDTEETRLPSPEQPLLTRLTEPQAAELIERFIDYTDAGDRSVHLAAPFVKHFHTRTDDALPTVAAIATLPIMLVDGTLLAQRGLDRDRGIVFRVPDELQRLIPRAEDCTPTAVAEAMRFLTDDFLGDVLTDYAGKCILIAAALSLIERMLLPDRPVFFVTAGRRGGGKTTTLIMLLVAVTGVRPSAAAWSPNEEERRKALLSYFMEAVPCIIWDNIVRGAQISCPHIEKSCTTMYYSDRRLGVSEIVAVVASAIQFFTGNNIAPRGDLASRSLQIRLEIGRPDPENREFRHADPIGWTEANRGRILIALYTIMLGNPALRPGSNAVPPTRFKDWWRLVGSAVEHASAEHAKVTAERVDALVDDRPNHPPVAINFGDLFLSQEEDDEETASLADALTALDAQYPNSRQFLAADLTRLLNDQSEYRLDAEKERAATLKEFLFPTLPVNQILTAKATGKRLKRHHGEPVKAGKHTLCLKVSADTHTKVMKFHVEMT